MTYEPTVTGPDGAPVMGVLVTVNNEMTGESWQRTTDGNGYANVALGAAHPDHRVTISIFDPQLRFQGYVAGDAMTAQQANATVPITLVPFERRRTALAAGRCPRFAPRRRRQC
jgi:hypothetical protein